jgi:hypothetical protein
MPLIQSTPFKIKPILPGAALDPGNALGLNINSVQNPASVTYPGNSLFNAYVYTSTFKDSEKYYMEGQWISTGGVGGPIFGIGTIDVDDWTFPNTVGSKYSYYPFNGNVYINGSVVASLGLSSIGDIYGFAYDADLNIISLYINNVVVDSKSWVPSGPVGPVLAGDNSSLVQTSEYYFLPSEWTYSPPTGFVEWPSS